MRTKKDTQLNYLNYCFQLLNLPTCLKNISNPVNCPCFVKVACYYLLTIIVLVLFNGKNVARMNCLNFYLFWFWARFWFKMRVVSHSFRCSECIFLIFHNCRRSNRSIGELSVQNWIISKFYWILGVPSTLMHMHTSTHAWTCTCM